VIGCGICLATIGAAFVSAHLAPGVLLALPLLALSNPTADSHWELEGQAT
jgi:hypothetical protein